MVAAKAFSVVEEEVWTVGLVELVEEEVWAVVVVAVGEPSAIRALFLGSLTAA